MSEALSSEHSWGISAGSMHWSSFGLPLNRTLASVAKYRTANHLPASVLLSRMTGEPVRLDYWSPSHPRGSAASWPPEAIVSQETGSGRFPLAAAWTGRIGDRNWPWKIDGQDHRLSSLDAITAGVSQLAKIHAGTSSCAIVIPNDFKQREQQKLLDACSSVGVNAALLWLPVAALLAWLDQHHDSLPSPRAGKADRLVMPVVHADWGRIRCSTIHLVARQVEGGARWTPARRRPAVSDWSIDGFGWKVQAGCRRQSAASVWQSRFAVPNGHVESRSSTTEASHLLEQVAGWTVKQSSQGDVDLALAKHLSMIDSPIGAIFVGDFAGLVSGGYAISRYLHSAGKFRSPIPSVVADGATGESMLANGAAIFARDRSEGRTSYLDTLPDLELFVDRNHKYDWLSLLGDADQFVAGGQPWELPDPIEGLALRRGATSIKLVVAHDEYDGVRELQVTLDRPAEQRLSAKLHVSATPAQGNAKLRLVTEGKDEIASRSILANWDRMRPLLDPQGKPVDKATFLKLQPRAFPELFPRRWSHAKWRIALPMVEKINRLVRDESPESVLKNDWSISQLKNQLLAKDQLQSPYDATAIGSDFKAPNDQKSLDELAQTLLRLWRTGRHLNSLSLSTVVRALGYISVPDAEFDDWLANNLQNSFHDRQCVLHTCGLALRSPGNMAKLFDFVFFPKNRSSSPGANELKAISQVLRYRADATRQIDSQKCEQVIQICLAIFEQGMERGGGGYPFRWASLIVVYMLRRRMFDFDFLDPEQPLATRAKDLFRTAIDRHKKRLLRPMGGSVDLPAALQQMIDYIDRKGSGDILMAGE